MSLLIKNDEHQLARDAWVESAPPPDGYRRPSPILVTALADNYEQIHDQFVKSIDSKWKRINFNLVKRAVMAKRGYYSGAYIECLNREKRYMNHAINSYFTKAVLIGYIFRNSIGSAMGRIFS